MSKAVRIDMASSSDFKLMDRRVVDALLDLGERKTFFRALAGWVGFRSINVEFSVADRAEGPPPRGGLRLPDRRKWPPPCRSSGKS